MPRRNVSSQDVYNHLIRFETWSQMEPALLHFTANNIVLDYKNKGTYAEVTVDGNTQAIRIPIRRPEKSEPESPAAAQEPAGEAQAPELEPSDLAETPPAKEKAPRKSAKTRRQASDSAIKLTIHGVEVSYREHLRQLVSHIVNKFDVSFGESISDEWIKKISGEGA